jgi:peptide/nickel transport system permease protein
MLAYVVRRTFFALLLIFIVSSGAVVLSRLAPGDFTAELIGQPGAERTIERERARLGLDRPLIVQYGEWLARAVRLDLGTSHKYGRPVAGLIRERAGNTFLLAVGALALATLAGLPLGIIAGSRRGPVGFTIGSASMVGVSLPPLVTSLTLAFVAARTGWFPTGGITSLDMQAASFGARAADVAWHLVLPALALAIPIGATIERMQAQAMAEALAEPCMLAALARGVSRRRVIWRHALRLAVRPVVAIYGLILGALLSGSFVVELVTAWPGLGSLMFDALLARDMYLVAGCAATGAFFLAAGSLASDLTLAAVDPRLREPVRPG